VGPLVASFDPGYGPLTHRRPYSPHYRLEAQPRLIFSPKLYLGLRMSLLQSLYPL
jgi:hypothetical protein